MYLRDSNNLLNLEIIPGENTISENYDYYSRPRNCMRNRRYSMITMLLLLFIIMITMSVVIYNMLF
jgi:hypothetical protein